MADEKKSNNTQQQSDMSSMLAILGGAVGAGASAALFSRSGLSTRASRFFTKSLRAASLVSKPTKALHNRNINDYIKIIKEYNAGYQQAKREFKVGQLEIDKQNRGSFFAFLEDISAMQRNASANAGRDFNTRIANEMIQKLKNHEAYKKGDDNFQRRMIRFVEHSSSFYQKDSAVERYINENNFTNEERDFAKQIIGKMNEVANNRHNKKLRKQAVEDGVRVSEDLLKKALNDIDSLEKTYGTVRNQSLGKRIKEDGFFRGIRKYGLIDALTGTRGVSIRDFLDDVRIKDSSFIINNKKTSFRDFLKSHVDELRANGNDELAERFLDLTPDSLGMRLDASGQLYSNNYISQITKASLKYLETTIPGSIMRLRDLRYDMMRPNYFRMAAGTYDPVLAANVNTDKNTSRLENTIHYMNNKFYKEFDDGTFEELTDMKNFKLVAGRVGTRSRLIREMAGDVRYRKYDNAILQALDLGQNQEDFRGGIPKFLRSYFGKFSNENYFGNILSDLMGESSTSIKKEIAATRFASNASEDFQMVSDGAIASRLYDGLDEVLNVSRQQLYSLNSETAKTVGSRVKTDEAKKIANLLSIDSDYDLIQAYLDMQLNADEQVPLFNRRLHNLQQRYLNNPTEALQSYMLRQENNSPYYDSSLIKTFTTSGGLRHGADFAEQLRTELSLELFMQEGKSNIKNYDELFSSMANITDDAQTAFNINKLMRQATVEDITGIYRDGLNYSGITPDEKGNTLLEFFNLRNGTSQTSNEVKDFLESIKKDSVSIIDRHYDDMDRVVNPTEYNSYITMKKVTTPLDILSNLNDWTKAKAAAKDMYNGIFASRTNMQGVSDVSIIPYFFLSRLNEIGETFNVGLSRESMSSTLDMASSILFKRILPASIALTYLDYLDDASEELTGTSLKGAAASGVANVDVAMRGVLDTLGVTAWLKEQEQINPIMQYWGDRQGFMTAEELYDYYQNGYAAVRKGAWWTFGSVNEARGGAISYWQPTFTRRANSNYYDASLYDGFLDKWSHSLLPTPTNPFSPIMGILDPYWLEEKHADDRPYPISGKMFDEGTPAGFLLNPTLGELIKPQKELHPWRLQNGIDANALMYSFKEYAAQKWNDITESNAVAVTPKGLELLRINSYAIGPTSLLSNLNNIAVTPVPTATYNAEEGMFTQTPVVTGNTGGSGTSGTVAPINYVKLKEEFANAALTRQKDSVILPDTNGNATMYFNQASLDSDQIPDVPSWLDITKSNIKQAVLGIDVMSNVKLMNDQIKAAGMAIRRLDDTSEDGLLITPDKLKNYRPSRALELTNDAETVTDLINAAKGDDMIREAAISARLVGGIYGYMAGEVTGLGVDNQKRLATSQDMTSFSRQFWDLNLGGAGGNLMEITRRFIPDFRRSARLNPLMNEMPDWLPERFKFGDPFTLIPNGEMRLPGKGYETLNDLHADMYGNYGAFDRFKILADIAPFSAEYKLWRDIAKKTVTDPALIEEMQEIKDRVAMQGKKHDFYDYKVLGQGVDYQNVIVSEVLGFGRFRSGDTIYKIAGARVKGNDEQTMKEVLGQYIHVGDQVTVGVDSNQSYQTNKDSVSSTNAAVFVNGENVGRSMIANGDAVIRKGDTTAPAILANYSPLQQMTAGLSEFIAHLDVPFLSDQFLRVRSPLESYKAEQTYGTPYQSWYQLDDSMIWPALVRATYERNWFDSLSTLAFNYWDDNFYKSSSVLKRKAIQSAYVLSNRGAFIGGALSLVSLRPSMNAARLGSLAIETAHFATGGNSYFDEMTTGADLGYTVAKFLAKKSKGKYAAIGAAVGAGYRTLFGQDGEWIPQTAKDKWELQDYFDRLTYLKYKGLYEEAARKALEEEDFDVKDFISEQEKKKSKLDKLTDYFKNIKKRHARDPESEKKKEFQKYVNSNLRSIEMMKDDSIIGVGEYARAALLYKKAMDSTMYGLDEDSSWAEIVTALPVNDREYFMEFVKERDKSKREQILHVVSPALRKALQLAWGQPVDETQTNKEFFETHVLPDAAWTGWKPDTELRDIEVKIVQNEGMNLSDFGFYENQVREESVINADAPAQYKQEADIAKIESDLKAILQGQGLTDVDVRVNAGNRGGFSQIVANVKTFLGINEEKKRVQEALNQQLA